MSRRTKERKLRTAVPFTRCNAFHHNLAKKVIKTGNEDLAYQRCPYCGDCPPPGPSYIKPKRIHFKRGQVPMTNAKRQLAYRARDESKAKLLAEREARWRADLPLIILDAERLAIARGERP